MQTNQKKIKELIGEKAYNLLVENGYVTVETTILETLSKHQEQIDKLNRRLDLLYGIQ